jgi:type II secretory pathway component PulF
VPGSALKESTADDLASAARQLQYALDGSATTDEAFQKLYAAVGSQQKESLRQLENLLRSAQSDAAPIKSLRLSAVPTLAWLLRQSAAPARSAAALLAEFRRQQSFSAASLAALWSDFSGYLTYLAAVLGVLMVVTGLYTVLVLPQLKSLYDGFGQDLPGLTSAVFGHGSTFTLMTGIAAALLAFLSWFLFHLRRQLRRYLPMPAGYQRFPLVGPVASTYNQYLWLTYTGLLRAAGMPADRALTLAGTRLPQFHIGSWNGPLGEPPVPAEAAAPGVLGNLLVAAKLGKLDAEAQFQQDASVDALLMALARCRRRSRMILTVLVYFLVASFVSAMYLPIFSLGSAI